MAKKTTAGGFTVNRDALATELGFVQRTAAARSKIPAFACILFDGTGDTLSLTACNGDQMAKTRVSKNGALDAFAVNGEKLRAAIDTMTGDLAMELDGGFLRIKASNGGTRKLPTLKAHDFPMMEVDDMAECFMLPGAEFALAIERTRGAASTDPTRENICCVRIALCDGALRFAALDTTALIIVDMEGEFHDFDACSLPIPVANAGADIAEGDLTFSRSKRLVEMTNGTRAIVGKLTEQEFPDYQRFMPTEFDFSITGSAEELLRATVAAGEMSDTKARTVKVVSDENGLAASVAGQCEAFEPINAEADGQGAFGMAQRVARHLGLFGERVVRWDIGVTSAKTIAKAEGFPLTVMLMASRI